MGLGKGNSLLKVAIVDISIVRFRKWKIPGPTPLPEIAHGAPAGGWGRISDQIFGFCDDIPKHSMYGVFTNIYPLNDPVLLVNKRCIECLGIFCSEAPVQALKLEAGEA